MHTQEDVWVPFFNSILPCRVEQQLCSKRFVKENRCFGGGTIVESVILIIPDASCDIDVYHFFFLRLAQFGS